MPVERKPLLVGLNPNMWSIEFLNPNNTSEATDIEYAIPSGLVVDGEDVCYQHNGSTSP